MQGAVLNAAKEVALEAFIDGRIGFLRWPKVAERVMDRLTRPADSLAAWMMSLPQTRKPGELAAGLHELSR